MHNDSGSRFIPIRPKIKYDIANYTLSNPHVPIPSYKDGILSSLLYTMELDNKLFHGELLPVLYTRKRILPLTAPSTINNTKENSNYYHQYSLKQLEQIRTERRIK